MLSPKNSNSPTTFYVDKLILAKTPLKQAVKDFERSLIVEALRQGSNDESLAAETLGISLGQLKEKIKNSQLD